VLGGFERHVPFPDLPVVRRPRRYTPQPFPGPPRVGPPHGPIPVSVRAFLLGALTSLVARIAILRLLRR
jgi:hypothetical protein